ncbi:MAG: hypothetical protein JJT96_07185 [Opitutales bacterium]|nr:hypothetical protein [Opitutales bacterium]
MKGLPKKRIHLCGLLLHLLAGALLTTPALHGVIVAGLNGGGDNLNNTTQAELEALPGVSDGAFFNNVFRIGAGNAVYIGYRPDPSGPVAYALSGMHIGTFSTAVIGGVTYQVTQQIALDDSDLALLVLTQADNIMPTLQALTLSSSTPTNNTPVIMIGAGRNRVQAATSDANTSDAVSVTGGTGYTTTTPPTRLKRWGTNTTLNFTGGGPPSPTDIEDVLGRDTVVFQTSFDEPASGEWLTTNQAQGVLNDSGGGVFTFDGILQGIMVAVTGFSTTEARFGDTTLMANIATYKDDIDAITGGALIPEPSGVAFLFFAAASAAGALFIKRRPSREAPAN